MVAQRRGRRIVLFEIALRTQPEFQFAVVFLYRVGGRVTGGGMFFCRGDGRSAEIVGQSLFRFRKMSLKRSDLRIALAVGFDGTENQLVNARRVLLRAPGELDVQFLFGAGRRHVEQVDVIDLGENRFAEIGFRKVGFGQRFVPFERNVLQCVERSFGASGPQQTTRFGLQAPVTVGNTYGFVLQSFGLVYRDDIDGVSVARQVDRLGASRFVPPLQEKRDIGDPGSSECVDLFFQRLYVGDLVFFLREPVEKDDFAERFFEGKQPQPADPCALVRRRRFVQVAPQVAVVESYADPVVRRRCDLQYGDDEADGVGVAYL